jgi:hypothetical protein
MFFVKIVASVLISLAFAGTTYAQCVGNACSANANISGNAGYIGDATGFSNFSGLGSPSRQFSSADALGSSDIVGDIIADTCDTGACATRATVTAEGTFGADARDLVEGQGTSAQSNVEGGGALSISGAASGPTGGVTASASGNGGFIADANANGSRPGFVATQAGGGTNFFGTTTADTCNGTVCASRSQMGATGRSFTSSAMSVQGQGGLSAQVTGGGALNLTIDNLVNR